MSSFVDRALAILSDVGENKRNLQAFEEHRKHFVPFVGAGLSMPMGYPSWGKLLTGLAPDDDIRRNVEVLLKHNKYEEAASEISENLPPKKFKAAIHDQFKDNGIALAGAVNALPAATPDLVLTTNLDDVLERAFIAAGKPFNSVFRGMDLHDAAGAIQRRKSILLKLHGSFADPKWILTLEQYAEAYGEPKTDLEKPLPRLIRQSLLARPLLFLGCSLQTDRTLRVIQESVHGISTEHFALLDEKENTGTRLEQFRQWNIKPLFFRGDYSKIADFLHCIAEAETSGGVTTSFEPIDIESVVKRARAAVYDAVKVNCGTMKILDMEQPIDLGAIYTQVNIYTKRSSYIRPDGEERGRIDADEAVRKHSKLLIYGQPGAGKSTFLKWTAYDCAEGRQMADLVPLFITLMNFESGTVLDRANSQHPGVPWKQILDHGRALVLLDGLDEVRDFDRVRKAVLDFVTHYPKTKVLMTCRISARAYNFEQFAEVETADFSPEQIRTFSERFFAACGKPGRHEPFLQNLKSRKPLQDLATKPLLLTLLCLTFDARGKFEGSRFELYEEGIDTLTRKWDRTRDIDRQRFLPVDTLLSFLEDMAYSEFTRGNLSFHKGALLKSIGTYFEARPLSVPLDHEAVLVDAQAAAGLLVEKARDTFAFSHLTFQEYLVARHIIAGSSALIGRTASRLGDVRWQEVWRLVSEKLNPEALLPELKHKIDENLGGDNKIQGLLAWANAKADADDQTIRKAALRALYLGISDQRIGLITEPSYRHSYILVEIAELIDSSLQTRNVAARNLRLGQGGFGLDQALSSALDRAAVIANSLGILRSPVPGQAPELSSSLSPAVPDTTQIVALVAPVEVAIDRGGRINNSTALVEQLRIGRWHAERLNSLESLNEWRKTLRALSVQHRDVGRNWDLTSDELDRFNSYLIANILLLRLMREAGPRLTTATRERLEKEMLLPWAELQKLREQPSNTQSAKA